MNLYAVWAIYAFEMARMGRTLLQSIVSPVVSTSLYFVVFGAAIGQRIPEIDGVSYGAFIVPGLAMLMLLTQSVSNASFGIYFPRFTGEVGELAQQNEGAVPLSSDGEVILAVEDNEDVRAYTKMVLSELGYCVLEAVDAEAAIAILRSSQRVDLLFTDVVLPGRTGRQLAEEAMTLRPSLKVLFTTGYSRNAIVHHGRLDAGVQLITKPFTFEQLAARIRDMLDL